MYAFPPAAVEGRKLEARSWHRAIAANALAVLGQGKAEKILKDHWAHDDRAALLLKAAVSPLATTGTWPMTSVVEAFRSLAPGSAAFKLFDLGLKLDLKGVNSVTVPNVASQPTLPVFVAEGGPAPAVQWTFGKTTVGPTRKILILAGITGELEAANPDNVAQIIGRVLADRCNANIDKVAFGTQADDGTTPSGLLAGVSSITAASGTDQISVMAQDLGALVGAMGTAGIDPSNAVFVAGPREAMILQARLGVLSGVSVLMTLGLPAKSVACFAPAAVASGYRDAPVIETSKEAVYHEEAITPQPISAVGTPNTVAAPVRSVFQTNAIGIRVRAHAAWAVATGGAQVINNVNW
jgi:hypothetical protein